MTHIYHNPGTSVIEAMIGDLVTIRAYGGPRGYVGIVHAVEADCFKIRGMSMDSAGETIHMLSIDLNQYSFTLRNVTEDFDELCKL